MNPQSTIKNILCERCASWDFDHVFKGDPDFVPPGPFQDPSNRWTWDRRPLLEVRENDDCKLCQFIYQHLLTGSWETQSEKQSCELYLDYRKDWLGTWYHHQEKETVTTLSVRLLDGWDPEKGGTPLQCLKRLSLQCFHFNSNHYSQQLPNMLAGRRIDTQIDFNLVQRWIKMCNAHGPACSKQTLFGRKVSHIRLIDIDRRRLI